MISRIYNKLIQKYWFRDLLPKEKVFFKNETGGKLRDYKDYIPGTRIIGIWKRNGAYKAWCEQCHNELIFTTPKASITNHTLNLYDGTTEVIKDYTCVCCGEHSLFTLDKDNGHHEFMPHKYEYYVW